MILNEQQFQQWKAQNPNTGYKTISGGVSQDVAAPEPTGLAGLISGITSPFRGLASQGAQLGGGILDIINQWGKTGNLQQGLANTNINQNANPLGLLTPMEANRAKNNPLEFGLGNSAQMASMAMPIGQGFGNMVKGGALAGAGMGGGQALSMGTDIGQGALTGGLMGGALGGVGYGIGEVANKLRTKPITVKGGVEAPTQLSITGDLQNAPTAIERNMNKVGQDIANIPRTEPTTNPDRFFSNNMDLGPARGPVSGTYPYGPAGEKLPLTISRPEVTGTHLVTGKPKFNANAAQDKLSELLNQRDAIVANNARGGSYVDPNTVFNKTNLSTEPTMRVEGNPYLKDTNYVPETTTNGVRAPLGELQSVRAPVVAATEKVVPKESMWGKVKSWFQERNAVDGGLQQPGTLMGESLRKDQTKLLFKHIDQLQTANKGFAPNFENLVDSADTLRATGIGELKNKGIGQANSFNVVDEITPQIVNASDGRIGFDEAKKMAREKIDNIFNRTTETGTNVGSATRTTQPGSANPNWQMDAGSWHDLAGETQGGFMKFDLKTSNQVNQIPAKSDVVEYIINKNAKNILKQSSSYKEGNDLFGALYNSLDKRTALKNANNDLRLMYNASLVPGAGTLNNVMQRTSAFGIRAADKMDKLTSGIGGMGSVGRTPFGDTKIGGGVIKGLNFMSPSAGAKNLGVANQMARYGVIQQTTKPQTQMPSIGTSSDTGSMAPTSSFKAEQSSEQDFFARLPFFTAIGMTPKEAYAAYQKENTSSSASKTASPLNIASAQSGLSQISKMKDLLSQDSSILTQRGLLPMQIQSSSAKQFNRAATEASDIIARLRTGAAINDKEVELYNGYIPNIWDDPQTIQYKFGVLEGMFNSIMGGQSTQQTQQNDSSLLQ